MRLEKSDDTKVFALGGLGEVGKNMYCVMTNDEIVITDAGMLMPEDELMGVDYVIPDFTFLKQNESKIKGLFITHGHEDHIGGIPFLLQMVNIPVIYAPNHAVGLIRKKLEDRNIQYKNLVVYDENTIVNFKTIKVEFYRNTHSIPDSHGICITTKDGVVVTTGDFKFDLTPIGPCFNIHKMAEIGSRGVTLLLSDSTNALNEGTSKSESKVDDAGLWMKSDETSASLFVQRIPLYLSVAASLIIASLISSAVTLSCLLVSRFIKYCLTEISYPPTVISSAAILTSESKA